MIKGYFDGFAVKGHENQFYDRFMKIKNSGKQKKHYYKSRCSTEIDYD